ncbi:SAM-dependent methyltransferase [Tersicoccus phoenicis]|uniref:SAM-dependent methyltransferase n=1 Tax=Tersicoccus phoenicis TaxID=554083 RepID=A0A1R1LC95_9MICC|nr:class I SAM-dependent methyltransferase [Tersicoccus phoenicis]OMH25139.1 SAM-dependent methyltransferase [Tersicoccus phoenicis]
MADGAKTFQTTGAAYDGFMGRYSRVLAAPFADAAGVTAGQTAIDVGCGPGALTAELVDRLGAAAVRAFDPSPAFVAECAARNPGVDVRSGTAERMPCDDASADVALAQLVMHFVGEPEAAMAEFRRVLRPGGTVAACVWDFAQGMEMLRLFWDAALAVDPDAPDEARTLRFGREGELTDLFTTAGLVDVAETTLEVSSEYRDLEELWSGFEAGIGPAGAYLVRLPDTLRSAMREEFADRLRARVGGTDGPFALEGTARCATGCTPG